jgi:hypothetical protein
MKTPRPERRTLLLAAALALVAGPAAALELPELMKLLAQRRSGEARFSEQRFVSGLDQTLRFAGTLSFTAPDRLARHTQTPRPESFVVEGNQLTLERGGRTRALALDAQPELAAMVTAMRGTLSGDASALRQHFKPAVRGSRAQWSLTLVPLEYRLLGVVREVRIDGRLADVQTVEVQLADGDRSVMTIEPIGPARPRGAPP